MWLGVDVDVDVGAPASCTCMVWCGMWHSGTVAHKTSAPGWLVKSATTVACCCAG